MPDSPRSREKASITNAIARDVIAAEKRKREAKTATLKAPRKEVDQENLVGVWKLISWVVEEIATGKRQHRFGQHPRGYILFTESGRVIAVLTGERRVSRPKSKEDELAAFSSLVAYSGTYRIDGDRVTTKVDISADESWVGTALVRIFRIKENRLEIETLPFFSPKVGDNHGIELRSFLVWERESYSG